MLAHTIQDELVILGYNANYNWHSELYSDIIIAQEDNDAVIMFRRRE